MSNSAGAYDSVNNSAVLLDTIYVNKYEIARQTATENPPIFDLELAKYIINNKLDSGKTVAIHFKTAKEKIIKIINFMLTDEYFKYKKLNFLLFGVVESDLELLILSHGFNVVNIAIAI